MQWVHYCTAKDAYADLQEFVLQYPQFEGVAIEGNKYTVDAARGTSAGTDFSGSPHKCRLSRMSVAFRNLCPVPEHQDERKYSFRKSYGAVSFLA